MEPEGSLPPLVPILSQINPIYTIPSYLSKIRFNIVSSFINQMIENPSYRQCRKANDQKIYYSASNCVVPMW
jgi:hypothetical protein